MKLLQYATLAAGALALSGIAQAKDSLKSKIRYGGDQDKLGKSIDVTSTIYSQIDMCGEPVRSIR